MKIKVLSDDEVFALIKQYQLNPCLWQKTHKDYKNFSIKRDALIKIAEKMHLSPEMTKEKLRSLRTIYFQNFKKVKNGKSVSSRKPRWIFFDALKFLQTEDADSSVNDKMDIPSSVTSSIASEDEVKVPINIEAYQAVEFNPLLTKRETECDNDNGTFSTPIMDTSASSFGAYVISSLEQIQNEELAKTVKCHIRILLSKAIAIDSKKELKRKSKSSAKHQKTFEDIGNILSSDSE